MILQFEPSAEHRPLAAAEAEALEATLKNPAALRCLFGVYVAMHSPEAIVGCISYMEQNRQCHRFDGLRTMEHPPGSVENIFEISV
ncbi:hypothetical protein ACFSHP_20715 [Novosphingobium panipatense]